MNVSNKRGVRVAAVQVNVYRENDLWPTRGEGVTTDVLLLERGEVAFATGAKRRHAGGICCVEVFCRHGITWVTSGTWVDLFDVSSPVA